ncbi:ATP-binding protein [Extensimonas sp. H3M7-6]|uniref:ATP-binding protein n=1 Tax=Extensimonas soli TaxID=3031322 RepID=UPI0023DA4C3B|nr:ATP-binding protein [Extensimonas sp. H3M7-6]MDF1481498.1 ATP-binding protein [Extensimonas sp. H3M7-6]
MPWPPRPHLPRTLFGRNLLLIVAIIFLSQLGSAWLYRELVIKPRVRQNAEATAQDLLALVDGLQALAPAERARFVARFNAHVHAKLRAQDPTPAPRERLTPLEQTFVQEVSARLALQQHDLLWRRMGRDWLAVRVRLGDCRTLGVDSENAPQQGQCLPDSQPHSGAMGQEAGKQWSAEVYSQPTTPKSDSLLDAEEYWIELPSLQRRRGWPTAWLLGSAATGLLALLGAWLIQRRINRPLNALVQAAGALGRGERPASLPEQGPAEIATVARSFNAMVSSLARGEQERRLMLAGLSHDLRTPLAKLRLVAELLAPTGADAQLIDSLHRNVEALDTLLAQFLDFVRADSPAHDGSAWEQEALMPCNLNEVVHQALQACHFDPEGRHTHLAPEALHLPLRRQAMLRLVDNLVANAEHHGAPPVEVATGRTADAIWLEVRDRGPGIAPQDVERLKQPFARGDSARGGPGGAGLGLAIVERIARAHGASFTLLPRTGGGTIARVCWPLPSVASAASADAPFPSQTLD